MVFQYYLLIAIHLNMFCWMIWIVAKPNRTLLILRYICENSDEDYPVTAKDIIAYLVEQDIYATANTIKADVEQLQEFGVEIEIVHSTQYRYFMYERIFELAEIKLLIDAAQIRKKRTLKKEPPMVE